MVQSGTTGSLVWLADGRECRGGARDEVVQEGRSQVKGFDNVTWIMGSHRKIESLLNRFCEMMEGGIGRQVPRSWWTGKKGTKEFG